MRALVADPDAPEGTRLAEAPEPETAPDEVLVTVHAVSLNRGEVRGLTRLPPATVPGWDVAGVVAREAADGTGPGAGTRVVGLVRSGAWAERAAVPTGWLAPLPDEVSFAAAASLPVAGLTAYRALALGGFGVGRQVLVTGASGGVGRLALQLAARGGAEVVGLAGSDRRLDGLDELDATVLLELGEEHGPFDLALDSVGGGTLGAAIRRIAPGGLVVTFGNSAGAAADLNPRSLYRHAPGARIRGLFVFEELARTGTAARDLAVLAALVADGSLDPQVALEVGWDEADRAIVALRERQVAGKAVLRLP